MVVVNFMLCSDSVRVVFSCGFVVKDCCEKSGHDNIIKNI